MVAEPLPGREHCPGLQMMRRPLLLASDAVAGLPATQLMSDLFGRLQIFLQATLAMTRASLMERTLSG
jgi:hypothetical protein